MGATYVRPRRRTVDRGRVCPACTAQNRESREFCVRCGELLIDQPVVMLGGTGRHSGLRSAIATVAVLAAAGALVTVFWDGARPQKARVMALFGSDVAEAAPPPASAPTDAGAGDRELLRVSSLVSSGRLPEALDLLKGLLREQPDRAEYQSAYARIAEQSGAHREASVAWGHAARLTGRGRDQLAHARALHRVAEDEAAVSAFERAVAADPQDVDVRRELGTLLLRLGRVDQARLHLEAAAQASPDDLVLADEAGQALERAGALGAAADAYRRVLDRLPQASVTRGHLAHVLYRQGRLDEAIAVLQEGTRVDPGAAWIHRMLADLLDRAGRPAEAAAAYREYARLSPGAADVEPLLARAAALEGTAAPNVSEVQ